MATHFKGPLIVQESGSIIPGLGGGSQPFATLDVTGAAVIGGTLTLGTGGNAVKAIKFGSISMNMPFVSQGERLQINFPLSGLAVGDFLGLTLNLDQMGDGEGRITVEGSWISGPDTYTVQVINLAEGGQDIHEHAMTFPYIWFDLT